MSVNKTQQGRANYHKGLTAEDAAAAHLQGQGYQLLEKRYKTRHGEIDLLMVDPAGTLVAVEVKLRADLQTALESIRPAAQKRVQNALLSYIANNPHYQDCALRFDVVAITPPFTLHHLDNAWEAQL